MFRLATKLAPRPASFYRYLPQAHYACRAVSTTSQKPTNPNKSSNPDSKDLSDPGKPISYSKVTMQQAEKRLGLQFHQWERSCVPFNKMLAQDGLKTESIHGGQFQKIKQRIYDKIVEYLEAEGYPTESIDDFNAANVNDLVLVIILPILSAFKRETGHNIFLEREKEIIPDESVADGRGESVVTDYIRAGERKYVFVVESMKSYSGPAKRQCMLALKDMAENYENSEGAVYGFATCGVDWQMIRYDGKNFTQTDTFQVLFRGMEDEKEKWMKEFSIIVDCIYMVLRTGRFVAK